MLRDGRKCSQLVKNMALRRAPSRLPGVFFFCTGVSAGEPPAVLDDAGDALSTDASSRAPGRLMVTVPSTTPNV